MKRIFNLVVLFFALAFSFLLETNALQVQSIDSIDYLQSTKSETVVFVSNNFLGGEICSQQEDAPNVSGCSPCLISYVSSKDILGKNKALLNGCFIHNLSTDKQKVHQIRAP